ncbi:hypothetical protein A6R68_05347 [Neotoma lepida]|uniref:Carboxylesterase type B domain-containing protein n=1 Tax=Neotoma lepida TaxID=56216 RepID=A0A1A6GK52_NEOLE|nr:hypothetical protein A6R68_05347 [Neotoma lepida]
MSPSENEVGNNNQDSASPVRNTNTGQVRGNLVHKVGVHTFLGIPFAKLPIGPLCFAPPEAPEPCSAVLDGTSYPAIIIGTDSDEFGWGVPMVQPILYLRLSSTCHFMGLEHVIKNITRETLPAVLKSIAA